MCGTVYVVMAGRHNYVLIVLIFYIGLDVVKISSADFLESLTLLLPMFTVLLVQYVVAYRVFCRLIHCCMPRHLVKYAKINNFQKCLAIQ